MSEMQQTSLDVFQDIKPHLGKRQHDVLEAFYNYGPHTNLEISEILGLPINQVTPRCLELRNKKCLEEKDRRACKVSGRNSIVWGRV